MHVQQCIDHYRLLDVALLKDIEKEIRELENSVALNGFQKWILRDMYRFDLPDAPFAVRSILLIAIPHPIYSDVSFVYDGKKYACASLVSPDFDAARGTIQDNALREGFSFLEVRNLPLKRIGVQSGLSIYGKNNITYIHGLGSCFSYAAFFTDLEPTTTVLREAAISQTCAHCDLCRKICPTGAIGENSFIIDNEKCLSCLNETGDPFPEWVPISAHHSLYDCLRCQTCCPMNRDYLSRKGMAIDFDEFETEKLLAGTPAKMCDEPLKEKIRYLGLDQWPTGVSKNIKMIITGTNPTQRSAE